MSQGGKEGKRITILLLCILIATPVFADVVIFDRYDSETTLENGVLHVERSMRIKNIGSNPIIPGELHFKLYEMHKDEKRAPKITGFSVTNPYDRELDTRKIESADEVDLIVNVWDPLLPDFYYEFTMSYDMEFSPNGLLFYELTVPREDTTIPIQKSKTDFLLPKNYFVTYAPNAEVSKDGKYKIVTWADEDVMNLEYSVVPLPYTGIRAVNVFWIFLIVVFLGILVWRLVKNRT